MFKLPHALVLSLLLAPTALLGCNDDPASSDDPAASNLELFDRLDFEAYNTQDWDLFRHLHCEDVVVTNPDGSQTLGIDAHVAEIQALFTWAPDSKIPVHPVSVADGDWTAVTGRFQLTFSEPMQLADGTTIPPTGKAADLPMATFAHWRDGCIDQEQLFLDNQTLLRQIGLAQ